MRTTLVILVFCCLFAGCRRQDSTATTAAAAAAGPVVLYTSVDEPYVRPIVRRFHDLTGIDVTLVTDAEASKSAGLTERILAERDHPKADVWWDNEVFRTVRLADAGVLAPYDSPAGADLPAKYKDGLHRWAGSVLRVRVLVSSPKHPAERPHTLGDLLRPGLKGHVAIARPTAGTTGGHVAALTVALGREKADAFFTALHANGVALVGGNSVVADAVAQGDMWAGLCDNDDAAASLAEVGPLTVDLPGQGPGEMGTLAMPCAVSLVANGAHPDAGRRLIDYLLSPEVDHSLVAAKFAWCSARDPAGKGKFMPVDYAEVAKAMPAAVRRATALLEGRGD